MHPFNISCKPAADPDNKDQRQAASEKYSRDMHGPGKQPGARRAGQTYAIDADPRCITAEPTADLAVAQIEPGESGKKPSAYPFKQHPQRGQRDGHMQRSLLRKTSCLEPAHDRWIKRQTGHEHQHGKPGKRRRHVPVMVHADIHPRHAQTEHADSIKKTAPGGASGRCVSPQYKQQRGGKHGKREQVER